MADVDEIDFLTDDAILDRMQQAASKFNHTVFAHFEDVLYRRYVRFDLDTFEIPFNRRETIQAFPDDVRERYVEIRKKMYPAENLEPPSA